MTKKNGMLSPAPRFLLSEKAGGKKPVLLSTVGSGEIILENKKLVYRRL